MTTANVRATLRSISAWTHRSIRSSAARTLALGAVAASLFTLGMPAPASARALDVDVWTDKGDDGVYQPGDAMRIKVRTTEDAYLLVYEIDSEGQVNLLFPWKRGQGRIEGARTLRLPSDDSDLELAVEQKTGQGFIVAVASDRPFREMPWFLRPYDPQAAAIGYDDDEREGIEARTGKDEPGFDDDGRVVGDPYVAMERIRRRVLDMKTAEQDFGSDYVTYYVHEQVRYPRYLCNDCHRPNQWAWWNGFDPYYARCSVIDFRVNWGWSWGPTCWNGYTPYYYYVVRSDCPPRYTSWYNDRTRFSSWDGWDRWGTLWGGQLRRYKPTPAPVGYVPPPQPGQVWREGRTPPGFLPPDVRRQSGTPGSTPAGWLSRDRGDGKPVWRDGPRQRPDAPPPGNGRGNDAPPSGTRGDEPRWREWKRGDNPPPGGGGGSSEESRPRWRGGSKPSDPPAGGGSGGSSESDRPRWRRGDDSPPPAPKRQDPPPPPRQDPPRQDPPRQDPPRQDPPRVDPPRQDTPPVWRQPPPSPQNSPKFEPGRGKGGKG